MILVIIAIVLNLNTLFHEYVLDDAIVMTENKFVEKGIRGIPEILSNSYFKGYEKLEKVEFSGGRYRPFALVIFAIEHQFWGANQKISHLINILLFALLVALLFKLLKKHIFREQNQNLAFITCLLFAVHPIHTEVIANVKSRDEIITFILLIVSLTTLLKYFEKRAIVYLLTSLFLFFLALLTRETAVTFIATVPLVFYFFFNQSIKKAIGRAIPLFFVFLGYLILRYEIIEFNNNLANDISNSPFLFAAGSQEFATKIFILFKYLQLMIFPHPLSFEYGFSQISYIEIYSIPFLLSIILLICLTGYAIHTFNKKSLTSFCILYFFITISLVANFFVDIGTPLSERFLFQPSLAICIVAATSYIKIKKSFKLLANGVLLMILILFSAKTLQRNRVWKNYETLVLTDVISSPNSVRANQFATNIYLSKANTEKNGEFKKEYLKKAAYHGERMLKICPKAPDLYMELGYTYYYLSDYNKAAELWIKGSKLEPTEIDSKKASDVLSNVFYKQGNGLSEQDKIDDAIICYQKSIELNNKNIEAWYNLGGNYFLINDSINAVRAWEHVKKLNPAHSFKKEEFTPIVKAAMN